MRCTPVSRNSTQRASVTVCSRGAHPELNADLASLDPVLYHLVSTHTKFPPSQLRFLTPLDFDTSDFFPAVLAMAEIGGALYGIPRNIDLLLHYRTDGTASAPRTVCRRRPGGRRRWHYDEVHRFFPAMPR